MGIGNVTQIQATWGHLPDQQHRLAVYIGRIAKDDECEFYGGRELLAIGLGRKVPAEPGDDDESDEAREARKVRKATFEAVRHCLRCLERVGFIELIRKPARGQTTRYKVHPIFNRPEAVWPVTDQSESGPLAVSTGQTESTQQARPDRSTGQTESANGPGGVWPKEEEDPDKDSPEDTQLQVGAQPQESSAHSTSQVESVRSVPREHWKAVARAGARGLAIEPDDEPELEETYPEDEASA